MGEHSGKSQFRWRKEGRKKWVERCRREGRKREEGREKRRMCVGRREREKKKYILLAKGLEQMKM